MGAIDELLDRVKQSVLRHADDQRHTGFDPSALLGHIDSLFGQHRSREGQQQNVRPASEDPYGDPAEQGRAGRSVRPASEDPYGDPADQERRRH
jgi:hypothetical protein